MRVFSPRPIAFFDCLVLNWVKRTQKASSGRHYTRTGKQRSFRKSDRSPCVFLKPEMLRDAGIREKPGVKESRFACHESVEHDAYSRRFQEPLVNITKFDEPPTLVRVLRTFSLKANKMTS